jgi:signal transduction histidine kinase
VICPKCQAEVLGEDAERCPSCTSPLSVAVLEVVRGDLPERIQFLRPRGYTIGRSRSNDLILSESSVSKLHARLSYEDGQFVIEDQGSTHGVFVDGIRADRTALKHGSEIQLGNISLRFASLDETGSTDKAVQLPWVEQQQLVLSLVHGLSSTLVLSEVLERVLEGVMRITRAERGFLLMTDAAGGEGGGAEVAPGLRVHLSRRRDGSPATAHGISTSVVRRAIELGETVATGDALTDPSLAGAHSIAFLELRTIVCTPLRSTRLSRDGAPDSPITLGAIYADNPESSAPFSRESLGAAEALARHAVLAIENARLFEAERRALEELRLAQKKLLQSEKLAAIGRMAAGIAHELNTPLTYILGNLELLQTQELSEPQQEMLRSIGRGAERLHNLARSLLAFSRPAQEQPQPVALNDVVDRALELCRYHVLKGGVKLEKELAPELPQVSGFPSQLEMALINLIVNAIQAMDGEGVLRVATAKRGSDAEVVVSDTGQGIPADVQDRIFEPFVTTKAEGKGTGLGLSTVLMVVERHHGRIDFTSDAQGTTFRISIPNQPSA